MGLQVLPFYLMCDESLSMRGAPIDAINSALPDLHHEIAHNPVVADKTQFAIIGFSDDAEVLLSLSNLGDVQQVPVLSAKNSTNYGAAFRCVKEQIETNCKTLKQQGHKVFRPVVFFLSDGRPNGGDWKAEWEAVTDSGFKYHPNIVAFGFGQADAKIISAVATFQAFLADGSLSPAKALQEFAAALTKSIVRSGSSSDADGDMTLQTQDQVPGFTKLKVDQV